MENCINRLCKIFRYARLKNIPTRADVKCCVHEIGTFMHCQKDNLCGTVASFRRLATSKPLRSPKEISKITISGLRIGILSRAEAPSENAAATSYFVRNIFKMAVEKAGLSSTNTRIGDATTFGAISDTYVAWACARLNIIASRNDALLAKVSANRVRI